MAFDWTQLPDQGSPPQPDMPIDPVGPLTLEGLPDQEYPELKINLRQGIEGNPDTHSKVVDLSKRSGMSQPLVERNLNEVDAIVKSKQALSTLDAAPVLKNRFTKDPDFAKAHSDNIESLKDLEGAAMDSILGFMDAWKYVQESAKTATVGLGASLLDLPAGFGRIYDAAVGNRTGPFKGLPVGAGQTDLHGEIVEGIGGYGPAQMSDWMDEYNKKLIDPVDAKYRQEAHQFTNEAFDKALEGDFEDMTTVLTEPKLLAGFVAEAIPTLAAIAATHGSWTAIAAMEGGEVASEAEAYEKLTGIKIDPAAFTMAMAQAVPLNTLFERFSFKFITGANTFMDAVMSPIAEMTTEMLQAFNTNVAIRLKELWGMDLGGFDPNKSLTEGIVPGGIGGFGAGGVVGTTSAISSTTAPDAEQPQDLIRAHNAQKMVRDMDTLIEKYAEVNTEGRDLDQVKSHLDDVLGAENEVYIDYDEAAAFFQPEIMETLPGELAAEIQESLDEESNVAIAKSDYIVSLNEHHDVLKNSIRNDMDGMTYPESVALGEEYTEETLRRADEILEKYERDSVFTQEVDELETAFRQQQIAAGYDPKVSAGTASLFKNFIAVAADKENTTPKALIERYPQLGLQVGGAPIAGAEALNQAANESGLVVAVRTKDTGMLVGEIGKAHFHLFDRLTEIEGKTPLVEDVEMGFADEEGNFYTREEALAYIKEKIPFSEEWTFDKNETELDSSDLEKLPSKTDEAEWNKLRGRTLTSEDLLSQAPLSTEMDDFVSAIGDQTVPPAAGNVPVLPIGRVERELIDARAKAKDGNLTGPILRKIFGAPKPRKGKEGVDSNVRPTPWKSLKKMLDWAIAENHAGDWYKEFGNGFRDLVGEANLQEASIIFGITSQQNAAETNFADTLHIMAIARQHNPVADEDNFRKALREQARPDGQRIKITGSQIDRIVEAYKSGTYSGGLKVSTYMQLIKSRALNEFNPYSVQDVHMARVFGYRFRDYDKKSGNIVDAAKMPSAAAIRYGQFMTSLLAQEYNLRPDQVQAYLWFYAKSQLSPKKEGGGARKVGDGTYESAAKYSAPEVEAIEKMIASGAFDKENALTQALETGTDPHYVSPVKKDRYTNIELNNELLSVARDRAGRAVVSANPGNARGYGFPEGTDLQTLIDYGNEVLDSITDESGQISFLRQAGIVHEVRQIMGTWDRIEPSFEIILPGETMETAGLVASILGDAFLQDAAITTQPKWEGQNFAVAVRKPDGSEFTQQEIKDVYDRVNPEQDPGGLNLSTSPDGTAIKFLDPVFFDKFDDYSDTDLDSFYGKVVENLGDSEYTYESFTQDGDYYDLSREGGRDSQQVWDENGLAGRPDLQRGAIDSLYQPVWETYQRYVSQLGYTPENQASPHQDFTDQDLALYQSAVPDLEVEGRFVDKLGLEQLGPDTFSIADEAQFEAAIAEYATLEESEGGKVINTDTARELSPDYLADRTLSASVHEPASFFVKELYRRKLQEKPAEGEYDQVLFTAGGTGAGKSSALRVVPETAAMKDESHIVFDTNMNTLDSARNKVQQALDADKEVVISLVVRDPVDALVMGALPRAERQRKKFGTGRTVPLAEHAKTHQGAAEVIKTLAQEYADNENVMVVAVDNTHGKDGARAVELEKIPVFDYNQVEADLSTALEDAYAEGQISEETYQGFKGVTQGQSQEVREGDGGQYQPGGQEGLAQPNRGQIQFTDQGALLTILENADPSTVIHELTHYFFESYIVMAEDNAGIRADMDVMIDFINKETGKSYTFDEWKTLSLNERRAGHEVVAEAGEKYFYEGIAPTPQLKSLFGRLKKFMLGVYQSIENIGKYNVTLTPEMRAIFDSMLSAESTLERRRRAEGVTAMFVEQGDMTAKQYLDYQQLIETDAEAADAAFTPRSVDNLKWVSNKLAKALRANERDVAAKRKAMKSRVTEEVEANPIYQAIDFLKTGYYVDPDGNPQQAESHKLDRAEFQQAYPNLYLPKGWTEVDGIPADILADLLNHYFNTGWKSGQELMDKTLRAIPKQAEIDRLTTIRMLQEHGDLMNPEKVEQAILEALHNDVHLRLLHFELNQLRKRTGVNQVLHREAKAFAERSIAGKELRNIKPIEYSRAGNRAGKISLKAHLKGDRQEAASAKRAQVIQEHFFRAANNAKKDIDKGYRYARKFLRPKSRKGLGKALGADAMDQIDAILEQFELKPVSGAELDRRKALVDWVEKQKRIYDPDGTQGFEPVVDPDILNQANQKNYKEMTYAEFSGVIDNIRSIETLARNKNKLLREIGKRNFEETMAWAEDSIRDNARGVVKPKATPTDKAGALAKTSKRLIVGHRKFASLVYEMDGFKDNGPMYQLLTRGMSEGQDNETEMDMADTNAMYEIFRPIMGDIKKGGLPANIYSKRYDIGDFSMTKEQHLMFILNWGNEGQRQRLKDGGMEGVGKITDAQAQAVLDAATVEEMDWAQNVMDYISSKRSAVSEQERRLTGLTPKWIEPEPIVTEKGVWPGGYFPAKYDAELSPRAKSLDAATDLRQQMKGALGAAGTRSGYTKARAAEVKDRPLLLSFNSISQHLSEVNHRLTMQDWLTDAGRTLNALQQPIIEHYGMEKFNTLRDTLVDIAQGEQPTKNTMGRVLNWIRIGATYVGLGYRLSTTLIQPAGIGNSWARIGSKHMYQGVKHVMSNPKAAYDEAIKISKTMKQRPITMNREMNEILNRIRAGDSAGWFQAYAFYMIQKSQMLVDLPTFWGSYFKSLDEQNYQRARNDTERNRIEKTAVQVANQTVKDTQSSGMIGDLAEIQKGTPFAKLWTNFYSYFSATYQLEVEAFKKAHFNKPTEVATLAADLMLINTMPAIYSMLMWELLRGECDWEPDCLAKKLGAEQLQFIFGLTLPTREIGAGVIAALGFDSYKYRGPAGISPLTAFYDFGKQAADGELDAGLFRSFMKVGGGILHIPTGQLTNTMEGMQAVWNGEVEGWDAVKAVASGPPR